MVFENYMFLNAGKCHFTCLGKNAEGETFIFKDTIMNNIKKKKILGFIRQQTRKTFAVTSGNYIKKLLKKYRLCQEYQINLMILKKIFCLTL